MSALATSKVVKGEVLIQPLPRCPRLSGGGVIYKILGFAREIRGVDMKHDREVGTIANISEPVKVRTFRMK